jgi:hypothetical protein
MPSRQFGALPSAGWNLQRKTHLIYYLLNLTAMQLNSIKQILSPEKIITKSKLSIS